MKHFMESLDSRDIKRQWRSILEKWQKANIYTRMKNNDWDKEALIRIVNSEEFKRCEISRVWVAKMISECEKYGLKEEIEIVHSRTMAADSKFKQ
jgi:hypothetical protein